VVTLTVSVVMTDVEVNNGALTLTEMMRAAGIFEVTFNLNVYQLISHESHI